MDKAPDAFRTISEVADDLDVPQHVLRFWESRFSQIRPLKRAGGRRYYRADDVDLLRGIHHLLYGQGYTIRGAQRILKEQGVGFVQQAWRVGAAAAAADDAVDEIAATLMEEDEAGRGPRGLLPSQRPHDLAAERREPRLDPAPAERQSARAEPAFDQPPSRLSTPALARDALYKLQAVLHELGECRRLLDAALE